MDMCKVIVHDYKAGKDVWFGPYRELEIREATIWARDESGRMEEIASRDARSFWFVRDDRGDNQRESAYGRVVKISVDAKIKAAS